jgi:hypothetical protein
MNACDRGRILLIISELDFSTSLLYFLSETSVIYRYREIDHAVGTLRGVLDCPYHTIHGEG